MMTTTDFDISGMDLSNAGTEGIHPFVVKTLLHMDNSVPYEGSIPLPESITSSSNTSDTHSMQLFMSPSSAYGIQSSKSNDGDYSNNNNQDSNSNDNQDSSNSNDDEEPSTTNNKKKRNSDDDMVFYKGRKILRSERLKQMRESQKKLRKSRTDELKLLRLENEKLKLDLQVAKSDNSMFLKAITNEMPEFSVDKLLQHVPPVPMASHYVKYDVFIKAYDTRPIHKLYINGKFFLQQYIDSIFDIIMYKWTSTVQQSLDPNCKTFMYLPIYGYSLLGNYIKEVEKAHLFHEIPGSWLKNDSQLPSSALSINGIVQAILDYQDIDKLSFDVLVTVLTRASFATLAGPTIFAKDLNSALKSACSTENDILFLTVDNTCTGTSERYK